MTSLPDSQLVAAVRRADRDAYGVLLQRHRARALAVASLVLGAPTWAEDVVQEATLQAYFGIERLRQPSLFGAWLCGICVNLAKMWLRRERFSVSLEDLDGGRYVDPASFAIDDVGLRQEALELQETVRRAVLDLPDEMRQAVWLHYLEGLSYQEVGLLLDVQPSALRVLAHRARARLRAELAETWQPSKPKEVNMIEAVVEDVIVALPENWREAFERAGQQDSHRAYSPSFPRPQGRWVVLLKHKDSQVNVVLPIWVGPFEGEALSMALTGDSAPRPLTYDLLARLLGAASVQVQQVAITQLQNDTVFATVRVKAGRRLLDVDARPSDALNLALRVNAPIYVAEDIMARAIDPQTSGKAGEQRTDQSIVMVPAREFVEALHAATTVGSGAPGGGPSSGTQPSPNE